MKTQTLLALALLAVAAQAQADSDAKRSARVPLLPAYQQECASCHIAYPPGLLPAASWQRITANLGKHYGSDAAVDAATLAELNRWLVANAGSGKRAREAPPEDRITRSAWFQHEHDEISAATWKRASIKSAANCAACHPGAEQGDFNEHRVRIPR
jgi:hypothetical protein